MGGAEWRYGYDPENRLAEVWRGAERVASFRYDAEGNRGVREVAGLRTVAVDDGYEVRGGLGRKVYRLGGEAVAVREGSAVYAVVGDHLGSVTALAQGGSIAGATRYLPYGAIRGESGLFPTDRRFTGQRWEASLGLYDYRARFYDPALGRFLQLDPLVPEPGNPQALNRYAYVYNNPLRYTDPSGHCPWCLAIGLGALIGAGVSYGVQVAANIRQNGLTVQAFTNVNWAVVGAGAVAGAVGGATFGLGTAVLGTGLAGTVAAGALSGAAAGQAARTTENILSGQAIGEGLGDPGDLLRDAAIGGALAGVGYGVGRLAPPATAEAAGSLEPPMLRAGRLAHQRLGVRYLEGIPPEQRPFVDIDQTFVDLTGRRFRPDVVNHATGEVVEFKPQSWLKDAKLKAKAENQAKSYAARLNELYGDLRRLEGLPEYWWRVEYYR
ncbi:RHS repeat-associated core domain-containing protein [Thermoflexus sp.]|uniref:RHS repeat-associated core domain-containing protein n=1 Tax=Thermoflexus sp. TaxID=1969742 RepID=UPI002ADD6BDB|nr:RHS repeat-associated core domain-containing protein [Thermoflexus sp.]